MNFESGDIITLTSNLGTKYVAIFKDNLKYNINEYSLDYFALIRLKSYYVYLDGHIVLIKDIRKSTEEEKQWLIKYLKKGVKRTHYYNANRRSYQILGCLHRFFNIKLFEKGDILTSVHCGERWIHVFDEYRGNSNIISYCSFIPYRNLLTDLNLNYKGSDWVYSQDYATLDERLLIINALKNNNSEKAKEILKLINKRYETNN